MRYADDPVREAVYTDGVGRDVERLRTPTSLSTIIGGSGVSPWARRITVTREMSGDVPEEVSLIGGTMAARVKAEGDLHAPGAPHPLNSADRATYLGAGLVVGTGYGDYDWVRVFNGRVRELAFSQADGSLSLAGMDRSDLMRDPVTIHTYGAVASRQQPTNVRRYPTNASAIIVACLHASGIRAIPQVIPSPDFTAPLMFGAIAEKGWATRTDAGVAAGASWLTAGRFGQMPSSGNISGFATAPPDYADGDMVARLEFWHKVSGTSSPVRLRNEAGYATELRLDFTSSTAAARLVTSGSNTVTPAVTVTPGWHHFVAEADMDNLTLSLWVDGVKTTTTLPSTAYSTFRFPYVDVTMGDVQGVAWATAYNQYQWPAMPSTADIQAALAAEMALIDTAALEVEMLPAIDGRDSWELAQEVASAELGSFGFDETGRARFRNRASLNGSTAPVRTLGSDLVDDVSGSVSIDSIRTRVTAPLKREWLLLSGLGASTAASTAVPALTVGRVLTIPPGRSEHLLETSGRVQLEQSRVAILHSTNSPGGVWDVPHGMTLCSATNGSGHITATQASSVTATMHPVDAGTIKLVVTNQMATTWYAVWPTGSTWDIGAYGYKAGDPAVWVLGRLVTEKSSPVDALVDVTDNSAVATWGIRTLALPANAWRQSKAAVTAFASSVLADLRGPRVEVGRVTIPGDPRLEIGDVIRLTDWAGVVPTVDARITGIEHVISREVNQGFTTTLNLRSLPV